MPMFSFTRSCWTVFLLAVRSSPGTRCAQDSPRPHGLATRGLWGLFWFCHSGVCRGLGYVLIHISLVTYWHWAYFQLLFALGYPFLCNDVLFQGQKACSAWNVELSVKDKKPVRLEWGKQRAAGEQAREGMGSARSDSLVGLRLVPWVESLAQKGVWSVMF